MVPEMDWPEDPLPVRIVVLDLDKLTEPCEVHAYRDGRCKRCGQSAKWIRIVSKVK